MELIYSMRRKPLKCEPPHFESPQDSEVVRPICTISTCNIIAFSSPTELSDIDADTWGGHVYVCDLDTPWDSHKVTSTAHTVSALEWDIEGKQLLVATTSGEVSVFGQKDYLLNSWTCLYTTTFPGEHIVKAIFFHNGRRIVSVDKKPDALMTEKFQMARATPTLKGFGGVPSPGVLVITGSGLVGTICPTSDSTKPLVAMEPLRAARLRVTAATVRHKEGSVMVGALCLEGGKATVRCCACSPPRGGPQAPPPPRPRPLPALHLPTVPVSLSWCLREESDCLLVGGSTLTLWKLTERPHPVHKLLSKGPLQGNSTPGGTQRAGSDCFNTLTWQQVSQWSVEGKVAGIASKSPSLAVLATHCALHLLSPDTPHYICSRPVVTSGNGAAEVPEGAGTPPKKPKYGYGVLPTGAPNAVISSVDMSVLGGVAVCVDSHAQLHVYRVLPGSGDVLSSPLAVQNVCNLLEYSIVTGYDCLDILMSLRGNIAELVFDRITESFQRQPQQFQQYYHHNWFKVRLALCRVWGGLMASGGWLAAGEAVRAGWAAAAHALRPEDRPDAAPLDDTPDPDKMLAALEAKPESACDAAALQALRRPLRRALHAAGALLAHLAHLPAHPGYDLCNDPATIRILRKMVVLARACGRGGEALSRPLARLQASGPKHDLQEECLTLSSQWTSRVWDYPPRCGVSAPHSQPYPLYLEYGVEPEKLRYAPEPPASLQADATPTPAMDSIRYMYLGGGLKPAKWRQCSRCGARAITNTQNDKLPLRKAHDARHSETCRCGGKWTLVSNI